MFKLFGLFASLALVTFVCHAGPIPESGDNAIDTRPVIETVSNGQTMRVPVFEDVVFTEAKIRLDARNFGKLSEKIKKATHSIIVEKKSCFGVAGQVFGFVPFFNNFIKESKELGRNDTSPPLKDGYGMEMSRIVSDILDRKTDLDLSDIENYKRTETLMNGMEQLIEKSPVGLYLDWHKLTIDGESMIDYVAPIIKYLRKRGYNGVLKVMGVIGGLLKNVGKN